MEKITKDYLEEYISELGEFETEHRRGATFYATNTYTFKQADIDTLKEEGVDASDFLDVQVVLSGIYDDDNGSDWYSMTCSRVEEYQEFVPEKVIPEHYVTRAKATPFEPVWE